jgi:hypothetical protein
MRLRPALLTPASEDALRLQRHIVEDNRLLRKLFADLNQNSVEK